MWLFTRYGFYSIACARRPDGEIDANTLMIRARRKSHLVSLQDCFPTIAGAEILTTPDRDYRCRILVAKSDWAAVMAALVEEQLWSNFKDETARYQGKEGVGYLHALHDVWRVMHRMQTLD